MSQTDNADLEWMYEVVYQIIRSPEFRNPIKDFIDDNCGTFIGVEENTFEQGQLHKQFTLLIDNLLDTLTKEIGITEEMFCLAAKKGLNEPKAKKYFEQLISFTNYNYFKNLMTKRNFQLEELAYKQMMADRKENGEGNDEDNEEEIEKKRKEMEEPPKEVEQKLNPVDKVALKQKMLLEHDAKMKNIASQKLAPLPNFSAGNEGLNKKLNEFEQNKAKKLQEYREMILKMKKEKRQKEENEVDDILKVGGEAKMSEEEKKKLNMRKQLADKLKAKLNIKK